MFQGRLAALDGAEACVATATGMAAVTTLTLGLLKSGDNIISIDGRFRQQFLVNPPDETF